MILERGTIVFANLSPTIGHEQRGFRPCVVVSSPDTSDAQRFGIVAIIPVTRTAGIGILYPRISPGKGSRLTHDSYALIDQIRAIDHRRIQRRLGRITDSELAAIDRGLIAYLGLVSAPPASEETGE
ncbi:type II toxin-antitoxin system PemK/MazF family toxin [bacterium]|nr:type II toxin-antitoxin system PemK/MazF family toxin [bacterium]